MHDFLYIKFIVFRVFKSSTAQHSLHHELMLYWNWSIAFFLSCPCIIHYSL